MAVAMLIAFWIWDEVTYNRYHTNHKRLAQVMTTYIDNDGKMETGSAVCMPIGNELRTKYGSDFKSISMASWNFSHILTVGEKKISADGMWVESNFPSMFSFRMLKGNGNSLSDPSAILINASLAKTLFGNADPVNKMIRLDNRDNYKVTGVFEDLPRNTDIYRCKNLFALEKIHNDRTMAKRCCDTMEQSFMAGICAGRR